MKQAMRVEFPDFVVNLGTVISKDGVQVRMAVTYKGETREKLMTCDEFAQITGFDEARKLMPSKRRKG
jgi:hypothetical protein